MYKDFISKRSLFLHNSNSFLVNKIIIWSLLVGYKRYSYEKIYNCSKVKMYAVFQNCIVQCIFFCLYDLFFDGTAPHTNGLEKKRVLVLMRTPYYILFFIKVFFKLKYMWSLNIIYFIHFTSCIDTLKWKHFRNSNLISNILVCQRNNFILINLFRNIKE